MRSLKHTTPWSRAFQYFLWSGGGLGARQLVPRNKVYECHFLSGCPRAAQPWMSQSGEQHLRNIPISSSPHMMPRVYPSTRQQQSNPCKQKDPQFLFEPFISTSYRKCAKWLHRFQWESIGRSEGVDKYKVAFCWFETYYWTSIFHFQHFFIAPHMMNFYYT
jgi:hypothetical protein